MIYRFLQTKMGPIESKSFLDFNMKLRKSNSQELASLLEPELTKKLLTYETKMATQSTIPFSKNN